MVRWRATLTIFFFWPNLNAMCTKNLFREQMHRVSVPRTYMNGPLVFLSNHPRSLRVTSVDDLTKSCSTKQNSYKMSSLRKKPHAGWAQGNPRAHTWRISTWPGSSQLFSSQNQLYLWRGSWKQSVLQNNTREAHNIHGSLVISPPPPPPPRLQSSQKALGAARQTAVRSWSFHSKSETMGHHRFWPLSVRPNSDPRTCHYWL